MKYSLKVVSIFFVLLMGLTTFVNSVNADCDSCAFFEEEQGEEERGTKDNEDNYQDENKDQDVNENEINREALKEELKIIRARINYLKWRLEGVRLKKNLVSGAYIVLDVNDREVLLNKNEKEKYSIASITKLMSSLVAKKYKDTEEEVTITNEMLSTIYNKTDALWPSLVISIKNLLSASLISSINDAAESLNHIVGDNLILMMNKSAEVLDMNQTSFADAHGISRENISSASDIARLLHYIHLRHPDLLEITVNDDFWLPDRNNNLIKFRNLNLFHQIPEFIGGKTGFTNAAKQTFAGMFEFEEDPYIVVLLYSTNRTNDTKLITDWLRRKPAVSDVSNEGDSQ